MADQNLIDSNNSLTKHISIIKNQNNNNNNNKIPLNQDNNGPPPEQQHQQYRDHDEQSQLKHNNNNNNNNNNNSNGNNNNLNNNNIIFNSSNNNLNNNVNNNNNNSSSNNNPTYQDPPDGGTRAWLIMISAFYCNSILFGIINTYGTIYLNLRERLVSQGDLEASSKASLPGSLTIGTTFLLSLVSGILIDKIGLRKTTFIGGCLASSGLLLSAVFYHNVKILYLTYGVLFGLGAAFTYTPTLAILGHYFKKYLGLVSGFVTAGSSLFTIILPKALNYLLSNYGLSGTFGILGTATLFIIMCAMIYKPLQMPPPPPKPKPGQSSVNLLIRSLVHVDNWKRKKYIVWALSIPIALFGYFVPYVHMGKLVEDTFPESDKNLPIMCIGITSGLGRLLFGFIADLKGVNRILLQQLSFFAMGLLTMAIPLTSSFTVLLMIALGMGLVDGCFITLLGPIAYDLCGPRGATQAIGFLLSLCSIPLTIGSPIAGMLYDKTSSYTLSFILAGIPPIIGGMTMFLIRFVKDDDHRNNNIVLAAATDIVGDDSTLNDRSLTKLAAWNKDEKQSDIKLLNSINESTRISLQSLENNTRRTSSSSNRNSLKQSANDFDNEEMEAAEKLLNDNGEKQWRQQQTTTQNQQDIPNIKFQNRQDPSDENHQQKSTEIHQPDLSAAASSSSVTTK